MSGIIRRLFTARFGPNLLGAAVIQPVLTGVGVFTFLAGVLYLPSLGPTRVEGILALLLLATVALLCTVVGQLAAVLERLNVGRQAEPSVAPDRRPVT